MLCILRGIEEVQDLGRSKWFTRDWTLQELIAPRYVYLICNLESQVQVSCQWQWRVNPNVGQVFLLQRRPHSSRPSLFYMLADDSSLLWDPRASTTTLGPLSTIAAYGHTLQVRFPSARRKGKREIHWSPSNISWIAVNLSLRVYKSLPMIMTSILGSGPVCVRLLDGLQDIKHAEWTTRTPG